MKSIIDFAKQLALPAAIWAAVFVVGVAVGTGPDWEHGPYIAPAAAATFLALPSLMMVLALRRG